MLTDDKIQVNIIDDYNKALKNSVDPLKTMAEYAGKANSATAELIKSSNGATIAETEKAKAIKATSKASKAATAGMKALAVAGNMLVNIGISAAISAVVWVVTELATAQDKAIKKAKELSDAYEADNDALDDYKERIADLVTELNDSNISYEESKTKRQELMSIQDELIQKYGTEKLVIESITDAINGEVDALDRLSEKAYFDWLASVDDLSWVQQVGNNFVGLFTGVTTSFQSALDSAVDYMEDKSQYFYVKSSGNEELDNLIRDKFGLTQNSWKEFVIKDVVPEEAYELLSEIRTAYRENATQYLGTETEEVLETVNNSIQSSMTTIKTELDKHQATYHTYLEGMIKYDSEYTDEYADLLAKRAALEEAELSANDEGKQQRIIDAKKAFYDSLNQALVAADGNDNVVRYFKNLYPDLYSEISNWKLEYNISANTDGLGNIAKELGEKYTAEDLFAMVDDESVGVADQAFQSLIDKAIEYGICTDNTAEEVQKLIDLLITLGIVQTRVQPNNDVPEPFNISNYKEQIDNFQSTVSTLGDALAKLRDGTLEENDIIDLVQDFDELDIASTTLEQDIIDLIYDTLNDLYDKIENPPQELKELLGDIADSAVDASKGIESLADALSDLDSKAELRNSIKDIVDANKELDVSTLIDIAKTYSEMEDEVAAYQSGLISVQELYESFDDLYQTDLQNYALYIAEKNQTDEDWYDNIVNNLSEELKAKASYYGIELGNYKNYAEAKLAIDQQLAAKQALLEQKKLELERQKLAEKSAEAEYLSSVKDADSGRIVNPSISDFDDMMETQEVIEEVQTEVDDAQKAVDELLDFINNFNTGITLTFDFDTTLGKGGKQGGETEKSIEKMDWYATSIERLEREISNLDYTIEDDTKTLKEREKALKRQIELTEDLYDTYGDAAEGYFAEANEVGLSQKYITKIQKGEKPTIEDFDPNDESDAKTLEQIEAYTEYYEKGLNALDMQLKLEAELRDLRNKSLEEALEKYNWIERKLNKISRNISAYENLASNTFINYQSRQSALLGQRLAIEEQEIPALQDAKKTYKELADGVDLSSKYKNLVRYGGKDAVGKVDAETAEKIEEYIKWIDLYNEAQDSLYDAEESLRNVYQEWVALRETDYNNRIGDLEQNVTELETALEKAAYTGIDQSQIFDSLIDRQLSIATTARSAADELQKVVSKLVESGRLMVDSEEYQSYMEIIEGFRNSANDADLAAKDTAVDAFNNIVAKYDRILSDYEHRAQLIENNLAKAEAKGYIANAKYYEQLINNQLGTMQELYSKKDALETELAEMMANDPELVEGSEKWYELTDSIKEVSVALSEGELTLIEYANAIRQIEWDVFDFIQEQIGQITNEADFLISLMENKDQYDDKGQLTDVGMATMGMHGLNYYSYVKDAERYAEELARIEADIAKNGENVDTTLINRKNELTEAYRDSILAAEDSKYAIIDMVEEGINLELESLQELIDAYGEALDSQKDLYDWQKKTANQSKNIAALQKQLSAYENDKSEEARAKIQQIRVQLQEAQEEMDDSNYEHSIDEQKELLEHLYTEYEDVLNARLDNVDRLFEEMINDINSNSLEIATTITEETGKVGATISNSMLDIWNGAQDNLSAGVISVIGAIQDSYSSMDTNLQINMDAFYDELIKDNEFDKNQSIADAETSEKIRGNLSSIAEAVNDIAYNVGLYGDIVEKQFDRLIETVQLIATYLMNWDENGFGGVVGGSEKLPVETPSGTTSGNNSGSNSSPDNNSGSGKKYPSVGSNVIATGAWYEASDGTGKTGNVKLNGATSWEVEKINKGSKYPYHLISYNSKGKRVGSGWVKLSQLSGYRLGARRIDEDELAWTQENGHPEAIIRPSDGAILTPLAQYDSVLNAGATQNIWDVANNPEQFVKDNMAIAASGSYAKTIAASGGTVETSMEVQFVLPSVTNYNEFVSQMQRDKKFEKMVQDMTINQLSGGTQMAKYRHRFA